MKLVWTGLILTLAFISVYFLLIRGSEKSEEKVPVNLMAEYTKITEGLSVPWQMQWLPPKFILFTELSGMIRQVDVTNGETKTLYQVKDLAREIQSGLMGLALHPRFTETGLVYISYNYYQEEIIWMRVDALHFSEFISHPL